MKIGFNLDAISKKRTYSLVKDKEKYKQISRELRLSNDALHVLTALQQRNHELFIFSPISMDLTLEEKTKIKNMIKARLKGKGIDQVKVTIVPTDDMANAYQRNHIDIVVDNDEETLKKAKEFTDVVDSDKTDMLIGILLDIEKNREAVLSSEASAFGLPSEDKLWLKKYRVGDFKWNDEKMSPYDRLVASNVDWLDEIAMEFNPIADSLPDAFPSEIFTKKFTYKQLLDEANVLAEQMKKAGIKKGVRVPVMLANTPEAFITLYALFKVKATVVPIFVLDKPDAFKDKIDKINELNAKDGIDGKFLFASDLVLGKLQSVIPEDEKVVSIPLVNSMPGPIRSAFEKVVMPKLGVKPVTYNENVVKYNDFLGTPREKINIPEQEYRDYVANIKREYENDYTAVQLFTGGTINSKGVRLSEESIDSAAKQFYNDRFDFRRGDKISAFMPLNHSFGLIIGTHVALSLGVNLDVIAKINFNKIYRYFIKDKINIFGGIPNMFPAIVQNEKFNGKDLSHVKYLLSGGAKIDGQIQKDSKEFFEDHNSTAEVHDGYGQTEAAGGIIYDGVPNMKTDMMIVEPDTTTELGYNEVGELCLSGPQIMQGYDDDELTSQVFRTHEDGKVWLHTGDLGMIDENGEFHYMDRMDRMIKVNGEQVFLNQIEEVINTLPFVEQCAAVKRPDDIRGYVPAVFIKLKPNYTWDDELEDALNKLYKSKFNSSSKPRATEVVNDLPRTTVGKINFKALESVAAEKNELRKTK